MRVSEGDQENKKCNLYTLYETKRARESQRDRARELVCNLWILPIRWHHLSQGLMTAPDHVISPCDPVILWRNYWPLVLYILARDQKAKATTTPLHNDKGNGSVQGQRRGSWILNCYFGKRNMSKGFSKYYPTIRERFCYLFKVQRNYFYCTTGSYEEIKCTVRLQSIFSETGVKEYASNFISQTLKL